MGLVAVIGGRYSGAYNSSSVGITETGYELQQSVATEDIDETDAYGGSVVDFFYRGANSFLQFSSKEYAAGISPFWPWSTLGAMGTIGRLASAVAAAMVLTSTSGTPAASAPATLTGGSSILAPNFPAGLLYNSKARNVPVRLQLLPYIPSSTPVWWQQT